MIKMTYIHPSTLCKFEAKIIQAKCKSEHIKDMKIKYNTNDSGLTLEAIIEFDENCLLYKFGKYVETIEIIKELYFNIIEEGHEALNLIIQNTFIC